MRSRLLVSLFAIGALALTLVAALGASGGEPNNGQPIERHGIKNIHAAKGERGRRFAALELDAGCRLADAAGVPRLLGIAVAQLGR